MTTATHTPGPWKLEESATVLHQHPDSWRDICDSDGFNVATVHYAGEEAIANARLIAAAPQMLAALERLVTGIGEALIDNEISDETMRDHLEAAHEAAFAAIKAARNE